MSSATTNGAAQPTANGTEPAIKRKVRKVVANPFASARQPGQLKLPNGQRAPLKPSSTPISLPQRSASPSAPNASSTKHSGFSDPTVTAPGKQYTDYKLVATKKDLLDGLRHHILHLAGDKSVDVRDPAQFAQPAHLHRRDPRTAPPGALKDEQIEIKDGMNEAERQAIKDRNEARKLERAANLAQIAPTQTSRQKASNKLKTKMVPKKQWTTEEKLRHQTNYEEKLPWHLEDFDNKICYVGQNQGPSARRHVALAYEPAIDSKTGRFRLIPVERVYEFHLKKQSDRQETTVEEAEARMKKRSNLPEWLERVEQKSLDRKKKEILDRAPRLYTGENKNHKLAGRTGEDVDLDYDDDDLFADDEEGDMFAVKDEDEALAEKRIREDQLKANYFEVKEEAEYDAEEEEEKKEEEERKENFRNIRRGLEKHEHNYNHASDSEYSSSSEDAEEAEERQRQEAEKQKNLEAQSLQPDGSKLTAPPSGATTPSGRKEKTSSVLSDREGGKLKINRKRPGSPNLSDAGSGTDTSTRNKKPKVKHTSSSQSLSRPDTPSGQKLKIRGPGAGSDTDAATMSDSTRRLKLKHKSSALPSRAASPAPTASGVPSRSGAASPANGPVAMPSLDEIRDVLRRNPGGVKTGDLLQMVAHPVDKRKDFYDLIKQVAKLVTKENGEKVLVSSEKQGS